MNKLSKSHTILQSNLIPRHQLDEQEMEAFAIEYPAIEYAKQTYFSRKQQKKPLLSEDKQLCDNKKKDVSFTIPISNLNETLEQDIRIHSEMLSKQSFELEKEYSKLIDEMDIEPLPCLSKQQQKKRQSIVPEKKLHSFKQLHSLYHVIYSQFITAPLRRAVRVLYQNSIIVDKRLTLFFTKRIFGIWRCYMKRKEQLCMKWKSKLVVVLKSLPPEGEEELPLVNNIRTRLHLGFKPFPAQEIFSREGKHYMANCYRDWYVLISTDTLLVGF